MSDDEINYEIVDSAFLDGETNDEVETESDDEEKINVMGPDEDIPGPEAVDPYNDPHGLRPGIISSFTTVL
eukprot:863713-Ditylum_brightwellii.AAC.2